MRLGEELGADEIIAAVQGVTDGTWDEAQVGAFLMAVATRGLGPEGTATLVEAMVDSGSRWRLSEEFPNLVDKHSTGGVGDKVSLILAPLLAAVGIPVAMLTGRALGHTGGTADKLETIPGLDLGLDRRGMIDALAATRIAIGLATPDIAPADRILYALRNRTGTVASLPLVTASIVSKKVALGPAAVVYDVKTGPGAIFPDLAEGRSLLKALIGATRRAQVDSDGLITDMSQPLGEWSGHSAEVRESMAAMRGEVADDLRQVTLALAAVACRLSGSPVTAAELAEVLDGGDALERFNLWARHQGARSEWLDQPQFDVAEEEFALSAPSSGVLAAVNVRRFGWLLQSKAFEGGDLDPGVSIRSLKRLGDEVSAGEPLALAYLRSEDRPWLANLSECWHIADRGRAPTLIHSGD